jgi:hypothetical protein
VGIWSEDEFITHFLKEMGFFASFTNSLALDGRGFGVGGPKKFGVSWSFRCDLVKKKKV